MAKVPFCGTFAGSGLGPLVLTNSQPNDLLLCEDTYYVLNSLVYPICHMLSCIMEGISRSPWQPRVVITTLPFFLPALSILTALTTVISVCVAWRGLIVSRIAVFVWMVEFPRNLPTSFASNAPLQAMAYLSKPLAASTL